MSTVSFEHAMTTRFSSLLCGVLFMGSGVALGAEGGLLTPVNQVRTVHVDASCDDKVNDCQGSGSDDDAAPDFGLFDASVQVGFGGDQANVSALAMQVSRISSGSLSATGSATADGVGIIESNANTRFEVTVSLDQPGVLWLNGVLAGEWSSFVNASSVSLSGPGGEMFAMTLPGVGAYPFHQVFPVPEGEYTLVAIADASLRNGGGDSTTTSFDVSLAATGSDVDWYVDDDACPGPGAGTLADPFCSIQDAIDAATNGETIVVAPGDYFESINLLGKAVTLRSVAPGDPIIVASTVIDATDLSTSVATCVSGEGPGTVLSGLTLTGGTGSATRDGLIGGGLNALGSSPTIVDCRFDANTAEFGGGIYSSGNPHILRCTFLGNHTTYCDNCGGGAIWVADGAPVIEESLFDDNLSSGEWQFGGGGLHVQTGDVIVRGCRFENNRAGGAGAAALVEGHMTISGSQFIANQGHPFGGGAITSNGVLDVIDCVFEANIGDGPQGDGGAFRIYGGDVRLVGCRLESNFGEFAGGAIRMHGEGTLEIVNSILAENGAYGGGGLYATGGDIFIVNTVFWYNGATFCDELCVGNASTLVENSIIRNDSDDAISNSPTINYSNVEGGWDGVGNISGDPLFVDAPNDFRLQPGSPCIDAGNNLIVPADALDVDGDGDVTETLPLDIADRPRFVDDPAVRDTGQAGNGHPEVIDMGPFERQTSCPADIDGDGTVDINDLLTILATWDTPDGDLTGDGITDMEDLFVVLAGWGDCL